MITIIIYNGGMVEPRVWNAKRLISWAWGQGRTSLWKCLHYCSAEYFSFGSMFTLGYAANKKQPMLTFPWIAPYSLHKA